MNYRHAFHAGNFADVVKHAVLARVLTYMQRKDAPFRVIDTHAGIATYDLGSVEAGKTNEWSHGIGRLLGPTAVALSSPAAELLKPYLDAVVAENGGQTPLRHYPGSPRLALRLMREADRLVANELHPDDLQALKAAIGRDPRVRILGLDAWVALRAQLPPKERRGVVLIDPPFEEPGEFERIAEGLAQGLKRFASGTFIAWYPIKAVSVIERWQRTLMTLPAQKLIAVDVLLRQPTDGERLNGCGLILVNAPYTLAGELHVMLSELIRILSLDQQGYFKLSDLFSGKVHVHPALGPKARLR